MGGSIAVKVTERLQEEELAGLVVIDVVEGTAIEALPYMESIAKNRP